MSQHSIYASARWTVASSLIRKLFSFALFFVIARILTKDDVGLFREYSLILTLGSMTFLFSLDYLLIVSKDRLENNLKQVLNIVLISSTVGTVILFVLAPILGKLYHSTTLISLIRYTSIFLFVENIRKVLTALLQRELRLKELAIFQTVNVIFYTLATLSVLIFKRNVWVLVLGFYSGNVLEMLLLLWSSRNSLRKHFQNGETRFKFFVSENKRFLSFAWVNNILVNVSGNAPVLILGLSFPLAKMGDYYLANQIIIIPITIITTALLQVFFPSFSRKESGEIAQHIGKFTDFVLIVVFPLIALFTLFSYSYISTIFGVKWVEATHLVLILSFTSAFSLIMNPLSGIPYSMQKPDVELYWSIFSTILKVGSILLGAKYGFREAIIGFVLASIVSQLVFLVLVQKLLGIRQIKYWIGMFLKIIPTGILGIGFWLFYLFNPSFAPLMGLILVLIYYSIIQRSSRYDLVGDFKKVLFSKAGSRQQSS